MKKLVSVIMIIVLMVTALVGCDVMPSEHTLAVGRVVTEKAGETTETVCALVLDKDGRIALARIDEIVYSEVSSATAEPLSKKELGDDYKMVEYSGYYGTPAIAEWYEQAAYLERALIGKTREEALAIETRGADIVAGCTIAVESYIAAVAAAFDSTDKKVYEMSGDPSLSLVLSGKIDGDGYISVISAVSVFRMQIVASLTYINRVEVTPAPVDGQ